MPGVQVSQQPHVKTPARLLNSFATFVDPHKLKLVDRKGTEEVVTVKEILLCAGGRAS